MARTRGAGRQQQNQQPQQNAAAANPPPFQAPSGNPPQAAQLMLLQPQALPVNTFALTPAMVHNNPIDYSTAKGIKMFKSNAEPLEIKFDLLTQNLKSFLELVRERAIYAN